MHAQVKAWCYYESRLLGAHHGLLSTYALETMVLYIFNIYRKELESPLKARAGPLRSAWLWAGCGGAGRGSWRRMHAALRAFATAAGSGASQAGHRHGVQALHACMPCCCSSEHRVLGHQSYRAPALAPLHERCGVLGACVGAAEVPGGVQRLRLGHLCTQPAGPHPPGLLPQRQGFAYMQHFPPEAPQASCPCPVSCLSVALTPIRQCERPSDLFLKQFINVGGDHAMLTFGACAQ